MSILKDKAEALRLLAAKLEQLGNDIPRKAKEVMKLLAPAQLNYEQYVDLFLANDPGFVKHVVKRAGIELGVAIGEKLRAAYAGLVPDPTRWNERAALYRAEVIVFTPAELEKYTQSVLEIGVQGEPLRTVQPKQRPKPLDFGDTIYYSYDGARRLIKPANTYSAAVILVNDEGKQSNSFVSLASLESATDRPGSLYTREPKS